MTTFTPDRWLVVKITVKEQTHYRVFASWYGGWAGADSWQMNSGITEVSKEGYVFAFKGASGSVYECHEQSHGASSYGRSVLASMIDQQKDAGIDIVVLPEETTWMELNY